MYKQWCILFSIIIANSKTCGEDKTGSGYELRTLIHCKLNYSSSKPLWNWIFNPARSFDTMAFFLVDVETRNIRRCWRKYSIFSIENQKLTQSGMTRVVSNYLRCVSLKVLVCHYSNRSECQLCNKYVYTRSVYRMYEYLHSS